MSDRDILNNLANDVANLAARVVAQYGELYPVGVEMLPDGKTQYVGVKPAPNLPPAYVFLDRIIVQSREKAAQKQIIAVAVASPSKTSDGKSAITVHAEHVSGFTVAIVIPYSLREAQPPAFQPPIYHQDAAQQIFQTLAKL
jgi:hypothetical protein